MASWGTPLRTLLNAVYDSVTGTLSANLAPGALAFPDAYALKVMGADTYTDVIIPSRNKSHILIYNAGTHGAIVSLDAGATDHIPVPSQSTLTLDYIRIEAEVKIQAKNLIEGSNFTNLYIMIW